MKRMKPYMDKEMAKVQTPEEGKMQYADKQPKKGSRPRKKKKWQT